MSYILNHIKSNRIAISLFLIIYAFVAVILPKSGCITDMQSFENWANFIYKNGLGNIYKSDTNYTPLYHYLLFLFGILQGSLDEIHRNINTLKLLTVPFDLLGIYTVYLVLKQKLEDENLAMLISLFLLFNVAYFYNTLIWGQVDGIFSNLFFVALYLASRKQILPSILFAILGLNMKLQGIIFIPFLGLVLLPIMFEKFSLKKMLTWVILPILFQTLILLPFIIQGDIAKVWKVVTVAVGTMPVLSITAFNLWYFIGGTGAREMPDTEKFFGITSNAWGLIFFTTAYVVALFPLLQNVYRAFFKKQVNEISFEKLLIIGAIIPLVFFFFNTQMHERYSHPTLIFVSCYAVLTKRFLPLFLLSIAVFCNMEYALGYLKLANYNVLIFHPYFVLALFGISMVLLFNSLYQFKNLISKKILKSNHE